jgi:hypothetical protein
MPTAGLVFRDVEVRTWPQRTDLLVIDPEDTLVLAYFPFLDPGPGKVANLHCGYQERARRALTQLQAAQEYLCGHYRVREHLCLRANTNVRERLDKLLREHGLDLETVEWPQLPSTLERLRVREATQLYALLCDWHDLAELYMPAGYSGFNPESWVHLAQPENCHYFHHLSGDTDDEEAYALFRRETDVDLAHFDFGLVLRWAYFHATEFADREPFILRALSEPAGE